MDTKEKSRQGTAKSKTTAQAKKKPAAGQSRPKAATSQTSVKKRTGAQPQAKAGAKKATASAPRKAATATVRKTAAKSAQRSGALAEAQRRRAENQPKVPTPEVVYTAPKVFSSSRFLLKLSTIVAMVIALTFGISIFFKVDVITVTGSEKYTPWTVVEASGIREGDNLLTFSKAAACGKIISSLPYVENVRIGIKLPDTVNIEIKEIDVVYAIKDGFDSWWLINSDGKVIGPGTSADACEHTQILGIQLNSPIENQQAVAMEQAAANTPEDPTGVSIPGIQEQVSAAQRLTVALSILQYLEANSSIGEIANVNVGNISSIELWYGQQYQVKLGDSTQLGYKIECALRTIDQLDDYQRGTVDCSFTIMEDKPMFTPAGD